MTSFLGLDLAHFRNGYVYHTSSDNISYVSKSAIQHTGDNVLALLRALIEDNNLEKNINSSESQAVFFDVFGYFMICYSEKTALIINVIVVLLSAATSTYVVLKIFKGNYFGPVINYIINSNSGNWYFYLIQKCSYSSFT